MDKYCGWNYFKEFLLDREKVFLFSEQVIVCKVLLQNSQTRKPKSLLTWFRFEWLRLIFYWITMNAVKMRERTVIFIRETYSYFGKTIFKCYCEINAFWVLCLASNIATQRWNFQLKSLWQRRSLRDFTKHKFMAFTPFDNKTVNDTVITGIAQISRSEKDNNSTNA